MILVEGRDWQSIVGHTIVRKSNLDSNQYELKLEADPFFDPEEHAISKNPPTNAPMDSLHATIEQVVWMTLRLTASPSLLPSDAPPLMPTDWTIERNGSCQEGRILHQVHMYDTWRDSWERSFLSITGNWDQDPSAADLPTSSMTTTRHDYANVCLVPKRCYRVVLTGGDGEFLDKILRDVRLAATATILPYSPMEEKPPVVILIGGGAPSDCTFSLPDEYDHHFCPNSCIDNDGDGNTTTGTDPPILNVMTNLVWNKDGWTTESLTNAIERTYLVLSGSLRNTTRQSAVVTELMMTMRSGCSSSSESTLILNNFKSVELNEQHSH